MDENAASVTPPEGHAHIVQAHANRIVADEALMKNLDPRALHEPHLQKPSFELLGRQAASDGGFRLHVSYDANETAASVRQADRRGGQGVRESGVANGVHFGSGRGAGKASLANDY